MKLFKILLVSESDYMDSPELFLNTDATEVFLNAEVTHILDEDTLEIFEGSLSNGFIKLGDRLGMLDLREMPDIGLDTKNCVEV